LFWQLQFLFHCQVSRFEVLDCEGGEVTVGADIQNEEDVLFWTVVSSALSHVHFANPDSRVKLPHIGSVIH
jgi:hypothetical protein